MDAKTLELLVEFLSRVNLNAKEIGAFSRVMNAVQALAAEHDPKPEAPAVAESE